MPDSGVTHDFLHDRLVQATFGKENPGFLLSRTGSIAAPTFYAHYVDATVETINPPNGFPRPVPDPAVKSKRVRLPGTLQSGVPETYQHGSRYSGQMRRVVQCLHSRGLETKFGYTFAKTHGILEFPRPRASGSTPGNEAVAFAQRRFWIVEISSAGVFAAPIKFGLNCLSCATDLNRYLPTLAQLAANPGFFQYYAELSLAWAYAFHNEGGIVQRLMTDIEIAPAYANGSPWYAGMGWAFSYSGHKAANVVAKTISDGLDFGSVEDYYETRLLTLSFSVAFTGQSASINLIAPGTAEVTLWAHGISEGQIAVITGAVQPQYNGAHVATHVTLETFRFAVAGQPATPATGEIKVANGAGDASLSATLAVGSPGRITFRRHHGGTLWVPNASALNLWDGVYPFVNLLDGDGPVHVFYDGDDQISTRWSSATEVVPVSANFANPNERIDSQPKLSAGPDVTITGIAQEGDCEITVHGFLPPNTWNKSGQHTKTSSGFYGPFDLRVDGYPSKIVETSVTSIVNADYQHAQSPGLNNNTYAICPDFGGGQGTVVQENLWFATDYLNVQTRSNEAKDGSSVLILLPAERECVAGIKSQSVRQAAQEVRYTGDTQRTRQTFTKIGGNFPYTNLDFPDTQGLALAPGGWVPANTTPADTVSVSGEFHLRMSGDASEFIKSFGDIEEESGDLEPFLTWTIAVKEQASSGLYAMHGGLYYADPHLAPVDQRANSVNILDGVLTPGVGGRFEQLAGKTIAAFVGQV